jgi:C4-dicarboxylate-specific signal transduction histidine kinase
MNSLDAMSTITEQDRHLRISSSQLSDRIMIVVDDSGLGLDPRYSSSMFDAFFTTKNDGIGMGLTISRSIIEAHGGRLWAEQGSHKGASLRFTLPIASVAE